MRRQYIQKTLLKNVWYANIFKDVHYDFWFCIIVTINTVILTYFYWVRQYEALPSRISWWYMYPNKAHKLIDVINLPRVFMMVAIMLVISLVFLWWLRKVNKVLFFVLGSIYLGFNALLLHVIANMLWGYAG